MNEATPFWQTKTLEEMDDGEWEALCDGCARCCMVKLEDEDSGELHFTNVACHLLDRTQCRCRDYAHRRQRVPTCLMLRPLDPRLLTQLPSSCAYRTLAEGRSLPSWHPLVSGDPDSVRAAGISMCGCCLSEENVHPEQLVDHVIEL
ncbi:MAG TPA: YcgN family cysteine cluster protein [Gammaproteobacteria bacterium]|nr:YcgN family cysteine cluster protein [Gammaproteobacteria bacterium]